VLLMKTDYPSVVQEEHREARKQQQDACKHDEKRWYVLNRVRSHHRDYILCLDCGFQFPAEGDDEE
jgi:predicted transcriptional regulator